MERVEEGDDVSVRTVKISLLIHLFYCLIITVSGIVFYNSISNPSERNMVGALFLALLGAQISSIFEIRDRWRYGQACIDLLRNNRDVKSEQKDRI